MITEMNRYPYFYMFTEARNDAKLRCLSDAQHRTWFRLLCYAAEQPTRGRIEGLSKHLVAVETAGGDEALLDETLAVLERLHCVTFEPSPDPVTPCHAAQGVTGVTIEFLHFGERNRRKPADEPERARERQAKSRARRKGPKNSEVMSTPAGGEILSHPVTPRHTQEKTRRDETRKERPSYDGRNGAGENGRPVGSPEECVETARELFGDSAASLVEKKHDDIDDCLHGRFDCYRAALREADRRRSKPGAQPIRNLHTFALTVAREYARKGIPPEPVGAEPRASPRKSTRLTDAQRASLPDG